jgi:FKBP-type peptidyl-prolyl cis-trans isomerase FkpA
VYMNKFLGLILIFVLVGFFSCTKSTDDQYIEDIRLIESYIQLKGLEDVQKTEDGLHYQIIEPGDGISPTVTSKIKINYVGRLLNDNVFDSGFGVTFELSGLITGWQLGIPKIKEGGKIKLIIPSRLAYGSRSTGGIPANSVLVFDIDLLEVLPL